MIAFDNRSALSTRTTGWERYARELLNALGKDVRPLNIHADTITRRLMSDWYAVPRAIRQPELVHFPTFPPTRAALQRAHVVYTLHDLTWWRYPETASRLGRHYYRPLAERAMQRTSVITPSAAVRDEALERFELDPTQVHAIHLGATPLPEVAPERRTKRYLLAVGSIEPRKNLDRLVKAYQVSGIRDDVELVVVGRVAWGPQLADATVLGAVDDNRLSALYAGAMAVVLPSLYEGFGLPVVEALSTGVRVHCSDIAAFREVAGEHATYFDQRDIEAIATSLRDALTFTDDARVRAARQSWAAKFTWQRCAQETLAVYQAVPRDAGS